MNNICPFQIIEETKLGGTVCRTWLALKTMIDYENKQYLSIQPFHRKWREEELTMAKIKNTSTYHFNIYWIKRLITPQYDNTPIIDGSQELSVSLKTFDVIRNPTIEEYKFIEEIFKRNHCKYNIKTNTLIYENNQTKHI